MKKTLIYLIACYIILLGIPFAVFAQGTLPYYSTCGTDSDCVSGLCEPRSGVLTCLCQQNSDCPTSAPVCNTITNECYSGAAPCTSNWQCTTQYCNTVLGICGSCTLDSNCDSGRVCSNGYCIVGGTTTLKEYGDYCNSNSECESGFCDFGLCACRADSDCSQDRYPSTCNNGVCTAQMEGGNVFCHILTPGHLEYSWRYDSEAECRIECPSFDCRVIYGNDCRNWCCLDANYDGQNITCDGSGTGSSSGSGSAIIPNPLRCDNVECVIHAIADLIAGLVVVVGTIMIIIGGIQYITSAGNEDRARRAKNTILYAIIGIAIAVSVNFIVGFLREVLSSGNN